MPLLDILRAILRELISWRGLAIVFALLNIKNLPLVWHYRFFRLLIVRSNTRSSRVPDHHAIFLPAITRSHAPLLEADYNLHKSNSTYLSDIDMSRGNLGMLLFREHMATQPFSKAPRFMLGGIQIVWKREIKNYTTYELWSRTLSWDDKWLYVLTTFVENGRIKPKSHYLQREQPRGSSVAAAVSKSTTTPKEHDTKAVHASAISRVVFKKGRKTVPPAEMFRTAGLLPAEDDIEGLKKIEETRLRRLGIAQLKDGWDAVHDVFFEETDEVVGRYTDLFFR